MPNNLSDKPDTAGGKECGCRESDRNKSGQKLWVKICGFTDPSNALECAKLGPDAIGLVFFEKSPRNVTKHTAAKITAVLPDSIMPVGVFVDEAFDQIMEIVHQCKLTGVQLHGSETPQLVDRLLKEDLFVIKALFAKKAPFLDQADQYKTASFILVEYGKGILPGGNAESWDYEISRQLKTDVPVVLAGGLNPDTVARALEKAKPSGVDVSSGVEKSPGIKDVGKVRQFIYNIKPFGRIQPRT